MIRVFPSLLPGEPIETHEIRGETTVEQWLVDHVEGYEPRETPPIVVEVDGEALPPDAWASTAISRKTVVDIRILPARGAVRAISRAVSSVVSAIGSVVNAVVDVVSSLFSFLSPSVPGQPNVKSGRQGSSIYDPNVQANQPKLGAIIPEIIGRHKTFPDYLNRPRKYFVDTRTQAIDLMLCIGRGHYSVPDAQIRIGATPIQALGNDVSYRIFEPGENVTSHQAHRRWYNAPEVGPSLGSSAGLRLRNVTDVTAALTASAISTSGANIEVPSGAGEVPSDWEAGMRLVIYLFRSFEVVDGGQDGGGNFLRDILRGDFADLELETGDPITISGGDIAGDYIVHEYSPGSGNPDELTLSLPDLTPAAFLTPGNYTTGIDHTGITYRIDSVSASSLTVTRLLSNGNEDSAWSGFPSGTTSQFSVMLDTSGAAGGWAGPFQACPEGEVTSRIEWDIFAPQGLARIKDDGGLESRSRTVELQYRAVGSSAWTTVSRTVSGRTRDQLGWTFVVNLPSAIRPEVRVRRTTNEATSVQDMDRLEWVGLRCELPAATSYPGATTMALTITGSDTIAGQTENRVSCVVTRQLPSEAGPLQATRSIADAVRHIAASAGYTEDDIDMDELERLNQLWDSRSDFFDFVFDDQETAKEAINKALSAGMAELTIADGLLTPVRDEPRTTLEDGYSPQNMLGPLQRSVQTIRPDDIDGVDVEYFDAETWTNEVVECRLPGDEGNRVEQIRIEGVTNRTRAWRIGMRERRRLRYRRWSYRWSTELDALNSRYLSYCPVQDDVPGFGQSALIEAVGMENGKTVLQSSEPLTWEEGENHVVAWRRPDGTMSGPYPAERGNDDFEVLAEMGEVPEVRPGKEPPHLMFGTAERWSYPVLITSISPRGFESVDVEAENYAPEVYADDNNSPD